MIRRGNEDCFLVADLSTGKMGLTPDVTHHKLGDLGSLLIVSDGMGGAVAGEIASDLSVNGVREEIVRATHVGVLSDRLRHAVEVTNRLVWQHAQENPHLAGMGATLTAVLCHDGKAYVAQVGDSRAYLVRGGRIKQLTKDQSLVQLLMDAKAIRPEQVNQVPNNVILQALGTRPEVVVAMTSVELCAGDYMMLCSDGLSNKVVADEMRDLIVQSGSDLGAACRKLIELANARGGEDNITTLIVQFDGTSLQSVSERGSITGSLQELTSNDLLRIGGAQLDFYHDPAADIPSTPPNVDNVLDDLGVKLIPTQPGPIPRNADQPITQVAIPVLPPQPVQPAPAPTPVPAPPPPPPPKQEVVVPELRLEPTPMPTSKGSHKMLIAFGVMLIGLGLLLGIAFLVYWFVISRGGN
jgi:protein phosphatase